MQQFSSHILIGLLLGILLSTASLWGQSEDKERKYPLLPNRYVEGYLLTQTGDTIQGYIKPGNLFKDQMRVFFLDYFGGKTTYFASRINGYGYEDLHYSSHPTPYNFAGAFADSMLFLIRVVNGPATLYRFYTRRSSLTLQRGPAYFDLLVKPDGTRHEVSYAFKWERLATALDDHPSLGDDIREELYRPEDTEEIIRLYNEWYRKQHGGGAALGD